MSRVQPSTCIQFHIETCQQPFSLLVFINNPSWDVHLSVIMDFDWSFFFPHECTSPPFRPLASITKQPWKPNLLLTIPIWLVSNFVSIRKTTPGHFSWTNRLGSWTVYGFPRSRQFQLRRNHGDWQCQVLATASSTFLALRVPSSFPNYIFLPCLWVVSSALEGIWWGSGI